MSITMQGSWTVRVKSKNAAWQQRFQIFGSDSVDGTYSGSVSAPTVFVTGDQWTVKVQHKPTSQPWRDSAMRLTNPTVSGGIVEFDINTNDSGADQDYNDLVLSCSIPVSASEFVIYGNVKTYAGRCYFNPCYSGYWVIDRPWVLQEALKNPTLHQIIKKLYPERVLPPRFPLPVPPPDFNPLVIPTGPAQGLESPGLLFESRQLRDTLNPNDFVKKAAKGDKEETLDAAAMEMAAVEQLQGSARSIMTNATPLAAGSQLLEREELLAAANVVDKLKFRWPCDVDPAPGLLLRFQEYDRTESEKLGGPITGGGDRQNLGLAVTDELGNYIFRFSWSLFDAATEASDLAPGEMLSSQVLPDIIVQVLGTGFEVDYESAPYFNIPNLRRINLCIPYERVHPSRDCAGDRVIQRIGDIIVLHSALSGSPNTLDSAGRITSRNANAPQVDCAAWRGELRVYACFGKPEAVYYTVRYRLNLADPWQYANETHKLNHIPDFAPGYHGTSVGSTSRSVNVDGGAAVEVPTYDSHEGDLNWIENDLKIILSSNLYRPNGTHGSVYFKIQGYTSTGALVPAVDDDITLYIDSKPATGDIESITMGATTIGDCALFELTDPKAPLTLRYRVEDAEGFLQNWSLSVTRGNNNPRPVVISAGVIPKSYTPAIGPCVPFTGTGDESTADLDNYVTTTLIPSDSEDWLPEGLNFCAFAFTLKANDRTTDGRTRFPRTVFWQDLIGLSYTLPSP